MSTRPLIRVAFARFWPGFDPEQHIFCRLLRKSYDIRVSDTPDLVFYSVYPGAMPPGEYVKVFVTGECVRPPWEECDWAFSFDYDTHPRHYRLPNFAMLWNGESLVKTPERVAGWMQTKTRFCNFVYYKPVRFREVFFQRLSRFKVVDAPGRSMRNMPPIGGHGDPKKSRYAPDRWQAKVDFLQPYRFTIAFENQSYPGYTTEKLVHAMHSGSIPIYWGNPLIHLEFNSRSFVNYHEYEAEIKAKLPVALQRRPQLKNLVERWYVQPRTMAKVIERVRAIENDSELYAQVMAEPWFHDNKLPPVFDRQQLEAHLAEIVESLPCSTTCRSVCSA